MYISMSTHLKFEDFLGIFNLSPISVVIFAMFQTFKDIHTYIMYLVFFHWYLYLKGAPCTMLIHPHSMETDSCVLNYSGNKEVI